MNTGGFNTNNLTPHVITYAFTVRCVLDLTTFRITTDKLCDDNAGYGTLRCGRVTGSCPGSIGDTCWAPHVWSDTLISGTSHYALCLGGGNVETTHDNLTDRHINRAHGVRCVLDLRINNKNFGSCFS